MSDELWRESASTLAQRIRTGEITSREVVTSHLERIEQVNDDVNAVVEVRPETVLADADIADAALRAGEPLGALHGVPFTVKINLDVAGYATSEGVAALKDFVATEDAPTVEKMRAAGAVMLARTNMPDFGLRMNTESSLFGATHNPWKRGYTAAGSSGGEAASIASGMSPIGLGNDIGGSLRNPAYCCGIASIKPSRGRVAHGNPSAILEEPIHSQLMYAEGVLARHVGDLRRGLEVVMGAHRRDPQSVDIPLHGRPVSKRVALVVEPTGGDTAAEVAEGVRVAGRALEAAGYEVEEIQPPMLFEAYFAWSELMMRSLEVIRPFIEPLMGEGGRRFHRAHARRVSAGNRQRRLPRCSTTGRELRGPGASSLRHIPSLLGRPQPSRPSSWAYDLIDAESRDQGRRDVSIRVARKSARAARCVRPNGRRRTAFRPACR